MTQVETEQEGERVEEARVETEQPVEETRKRRREAEEARAKRREENVSDLVRRDKLQHKDFIGERGSSKLISPFLEIVKSKGWHLLCEHKAPSLVDVVKEFYTNSILSYYRGRYRGLVPHPALITRLCILRGCRKRLGGRRDLL